MTLEFIAHTVYALAEVAAQVSNKATARSAYALPTSFNALCKAVRTGKAPASLIEAVGDLSWYGIVHEMRTEWTHYSSPFVSAFSDPAQFRVYTERLANQRNHLAEPAIFTLDEFTTAVHGAIGATERLAGYIIVEHVLPALDRNVVRDYIVRTPRGLPVIRDGRMVLEKRTIGELLKDCGIAS